MDISIIIPTYNRKDKLRQCLESLAQQNYPKENLEVIVVDDGSDDGTTKMLEQLLEKQTNLRYFVQRHKGPAAARNLGITQSRANIIGFIDSDCIPEANWVRNMVLSHSIEETASAVGGLTRVDVRNIKAMVSQFLSDGAIKARINGKQEIIFFPTCNVSLKKSFLEREAFNEMFPSPAGEDLEFFWRNFKKGKKFIYNTDIKLLHDCNPNLTTFLKQAYMYGQGNYLVQYIHRDHPLLKEIHTNNDFNFFYGLIINILKMPRFSYILGSRLISKFTVYNSHEIILVYFYFTLHKIMYLIGNVAGHKKAKQLHKDKLFKTEEEKSSLMKPDFIILDITHRCNLRCNICKIWKDKSIKEFNTADVKNLISQSIEWGIKEFVLSGGEPFIRKDIFEVLDFVKENNYHIGILTNGIILTRSFINMLFPFLVSGTLSLSISLDALTPEIHDDIRGSRGCFENTVSGLKILSELKKIHTNINFNVISIILNENLDELLPLANFFRGLDVNSLQFQPLLANNLIMKERSDKAKYWVPFERLSHLDRVIDDLIDFKRRNSFFVRNSEHNLSLVKKYFRGTLAQFDVTCLYANKIMLISDNGDVTTCLECYGNVKNTSLKEIFHSPQAEYARKRVGLCKRPCLLPCFVDY